eukprot:TRINITY_DN4302_c0_g1_i2.p1 TRINITY_DN4302_c0_g1~~TRINITY_DN4302_c0_g1_i2.p1  ORF type:complete len:188 (-),score=56.99 TRINITY_DN4302_c0_g1_i2:190-753(-)
MAKKTKKMKKDEEEMDYDEEGGGGCNIENEQITIFSKPPIAEICVFIVKYLKPRELLVLPRLSKEWKKWTEKSKDYNYIWYRLCMKAWWSTGSDCVKQKIPSKMNSKDAKKNWKEVFLRIPPVPEDVPVPLLHQKTEKIQPEIVEEVGATPTEYKKEMRAFYKTIRSKPKGKEACRDNSHKSDWMWE